ncbi:type II toxin-antitoxin system RelE/ParE family toxin [Cyclobacterium sp. 1_MG-2023]|uniref:type II toxin-antitoxin system RelE/ParE family toxin n=2 Tax=Cyclobacterium sp. 1_MG-2023 TaxID=3062681 RepID=UPI0026E1D2AC|nr:type II toxin-antitoxin system RelE/ParE family toxin [Cyclobacterium sp. 1_MG-2023]MDO6440292.1 type II toxin-antitoxin system RelE/ParE family toxin [Cyclobacterium sp. 1_MG-2023]
MSYKVIPTPEFKKLAKKYPSLKTDLQHLIETLVENPVLGIRLGHNLYKIRMKISSKNKGKSGGARVITFIVTEDREVYLLHIYDKSQLENLTKEQIIELINNAGL